MVMMYQCRFMDCSELPTIVRERPLLGRVLHAERREVPAQKTSVFSIQVCSESKTALEKYKVY